MIDRTISLAEARRVYNTLGTRLDRAARFEARAKAVALAELASQPGQRVLHIGVGTGYEHAKLRDAVAPNGTAVGLDLSRRMLEVSRARVATPLVEGDTVRLPFASASVDRLFSAYVLDLLPAPDLPVVLAEFRRVLRPGGRLALVSLTHGVTLPSRLFVAGWRLGLRIAPRRFGGCRPLQLGPLLTAASFEGRSQIVVQRGFPSEILIAERPG